MDFLASLFGGSAGGGGGPTSSAQADSAQGGDTINQGGNLTVLIAVAVLALVGLVGLILVLRK